MVEAVATELADRDAALRQLKRHLHRAHEQMMSYVDKKQKDYYAFEVGECLFLKLRPHQHQTVARKINQNLSPRYFGVWTLSNT